MAKIVIKNILRSFGIGLLAVLVTGIVILLLLLLMGLIILFLYWIKVEEKVITIATNVFYVLMLITGIIVAIIATNIFSDYAGRAVQNDEDGYKGKHFPTTVGLNSVPCIPLIFSLLLLPVFVLCIVAYFMPTLEIGIAKLFPNLSVSLFHEILFLGSGMIGSFIVTLFRYYIIMLIKYRAEVVCSACKHAFCVRQYDEKVDYSDVTDIQTTKEHKKVATLESKGYTPVDVYQDVITKKERKGVKAERKLFCQCAVCGAKSERYRTAISYKE